MKTANNGSPGGGRGAAPMSDDTAEILRRFDLPAYLETEHGCKVQRNGDKARCAAAWRGGDGPNVALDLEDGKWKWYDHARGEGGDAITFLQAWEDLSQKEAWDRAREITGVRPSFDRATPGPTAPPKRPKPKPDAKTSKPESQAPKPVPFNPAELPLQTFAKKMPGWKLAGWHVLYDIEGRPMAVQTRYEKPGEKKLPLYWTHGADGGWKSSLRGLPLGGLWFRLPEVLDRPEAPVLIVEGPKTAEAAAVTLTGYAVVSPPGGKGSLKNADWSPFKGRRVTLWPDADADHGSQAAFSDAAEPLAAAGAAEVRLVELPPGLPDGWDLADPTPEGVNVLELLERAAVVAGAKQPEEAPPRWVMSSLSEVASLPPIPWLVEDTFREKGFILLYGESGAGKSWTALDLALSIATGSPWGPRETRPGRVLYLTLEDCKAGTLPRARAWMKARGLTVPDDTLKLIDEPVQLDSDAEVAAFIQAVRESGFRPDLTIFDTLALSTAGIDENTAKDAGAVVGNVKRIQRELESAVMLVHHAKKDDPRTYRGSTSWMAAVDTMMAVVKRDDGGFIIECSKQRSAPRFQTTRWKLEPVPGVMWGDTQMVTTRYESDDLPGMPGNLAGSSGGGKLTAGRKLTLRTVERLTIDKGGATLAELHKETGVSKGTISGQLTWLRVYGYIFREPETDRWHTSRESVPHHRHPPAEGVRERSEKNPNGSDTGGVRERSENTPNAWESSDDADSW